MRSRTLRPSARSGGGRAVVLGVLAALTACIPAPAWAAPEHVDLAYQTPPNCPAPAFFVREVRARTAQVEFGGGAPPTIRFDVRVQGFPGAYSGVLGIDDAGGRSIRTFQAARCDEVVVALALVAALAVDPNASTAPGALSVQSSDIAPPAPAAPAAAPWIWALGATADVQSGVTQSWLIALGAFVGVRRDAAGLSPSFRLNPYYAQTGLTGPSADAAEYYLLAARTEGCPTALPLARTVRFWPCLGVDAGLLHARGVAVAQPDTQNRLWLSLLLDLRLELELFDDLLVEASAGPVLPLTQHVFVFRNPDQVVHDVPWLAARAGVAVGARFP